MNVHVKIQGVLGILRGKCLFPGIWLFAPKTNHEIINTDLSPNAGNKYFINPLVPEVYWKVTHT